MNLSAPTLLGLLLVSSLAGCGTEADCGSPRSCEGAATPMLMSVATLSTRTEDASLTVIDLRDEASYLAGHVPGAVWIDAEDIRTEIDGVAGQVAPAAQIEASLSAAGVSTGDELVAYDDGTGLLAARFAWTMMYYDMPPADVLDGGWPEWEAGDESIEQGESEPDSADFALGPIEDSLRVDAAWVLDHLDDPGVEFIDARSAAEYEDGHIPGAINIEWASTKAGNLFLPTDELAALYQDLDPDAETLVAYCKSGTRGSVTWSTLTLLGNPDVRLYDGSWNEWGSNPDYPKEP